MNGENRSCIPERDCRTETVVPKVDDLLKADWETLVIRHDKETGQYSWLTQTCKEKDAPSTDLSQIQLMTGPLD